MNNFLKYSYQEEIIRDGIIPTREDLDRLVVKDLTLDGTESIDFYKKYKNQSRYYKSVDLPSENDIDNESLHNRKYNQICCIS